MSRLRCLVVLSGRRISGGPRAFTLNSETPFTRYNPLSMRLYNRFNNRLYRVNGL